MNIIGTLDKPDSGDVLFDGSSLTGKHPDDLADYRNRNIGFVFQDHLLFRHLTIRDNIMLPLFSSRISESELSEKEIFCTELMKHVGIKEIENKFPFQVSGGEAQRATLVRALIRKPSVLLADEPTGSLDAKNADALGNLLMQMNKELGITLIVATHSMDLSSRMERHLKLHDGILTE
jgi:ABC-type lipoprotein export system ATPase subunit